MIINERLSFDALFRASEPKRVIRSETVRGPPMEVDAGQDSTYHFFNFKSFPSTTGLRHKGYVRFFKPRSPKPLQHLECEVDCGCPDFKFRWAWANKQRGSSRVGPSSLNQAWNRAPRITNPSGKPGLCKHILAVRDFIYGLVGYFPGADEEDTSSDKLDKLTAKSQKLWTDYPGAMALAREREARYAAGRAAKNVGVPVPPGLEGEEEPEEEMPPPMPLDELPPPPLAVPPGERGRNLPSAMPPELPTPLGIPPGKRGRTLPPPNRRNESVVMVGLADMNTNIDLRDARAALKIVEQMEDDAKSEMMPPPDVPVPEAGLDPMEPPVSDSAVGADTEGATAIGLLSDISNSLQTLVTALAPEESSEGEEEEVLPPGAEEEGPDIGVPDPTQEEDEETEPVTAP